MYAWVRRAFGPFHGAICGWCLWVNNLFYFPALLLFAAANLAVVFAGAAPALADNRWFSTIFVLGCLWALVALNIRGFAAGRWLQNVGAIGTWVPAALVIVAGGVALAWFGSATSFAPAALRAARRHARARWRSGRASVSRSRASRSAPSRARRSNDPERDAATRHHRRRRDRRRVDLHARHGGDAGGGAGRRAGRAQRPRRRGGSRRPAASACRRSAR